MSPLELLSELVAERLQFAASVALLMIGAVTAWTSTNVFKRVAGLVIALIAAILALAVLGAPSFALMAGVSAAAANLLIGLALLVRLQESYGGVETPEFDLADDQSEPTEPGA